MFRFIALLFITKLAFAQFGTISVKKDIKNDIGPFEYKLLYYKVLGDKTAELSYWQIHVWDTTTTPYISDTSAIKLINNLLMKRGLQLYMKLFLNKPFFDKYICGLTKVDNYVLSRITVGQSGHPASFHLLITYCGRRD